MYYSSISNIFQSPHLTSIQNLHHGNHGALGSQGEGVGSSGATRGVERTHKLRGLYNVKKLGVGGIIRIFKILYNIYITNNIQIIYI